MNYGEKAVGKDFNPSGIATVDELKELYAKIINICHEYTPNGHEQQRLLAIAKTEAQGAQMWAVKAVTWVEPETKHG